MKKKQAIFAGNDMEGLLNFIAREVAEDFFPSEEAFLEEYPEDTPQEYIVSISIEKT